MKLLRVYLLELKAKPKNLKNEKNKFFTFLILFSLQNFFAGTYKVYVAEKFKVKLNNKERIFEVHREKGKESIVPSDTAYMALEAALFAQTISNPLWQEDLSRDVKVAENVLNIAGNSIVSKVLSMGKDIVNYSSGLSNAVKELGEVLKLESIEKVEDFISKLSESFQDPLYRLTARVLADPYYYAAKEACDVAHAFLDQANYIENILKSDVVLYNNAVFIPKYLAELRAELRPLPELLKTIEKELEVSEADVEGIYDIVKKGKEEELKKLRERAMKKVENTEAYKKYEKQVSKIFDLEIKKIPKNHLAFWHYKY
ncbi:MAG: hypothetical protein QXQ82_00665 [Candidatus Pacearchaeota archaeon]